MAQILGAAATVGFALVVFNGQPAVTGSTSEPSTLLAGSPVAAPSAANGRPTVAVLPFHIYAPGGEYTHLAGSLSDLLVTELANGRALNVTSTTSTLRYRTATSTVPEIGRQLGVSHLVEGSMTVAGRRARINAQLIYAVSDRHLWARSFDVALDDVLAVERRLAVAIAREVHNALASSSARR